MALVSLSSGTQATTVGTTPDTLFTTTQGKTCVLALDLSNMAGSSSTPDILEAIILYNVLTASSGNARELYRAVYQGGLIPQPIVVSAPVPALRWAQFQIVQTQGTSRNVDWIVMSID